MSVAHPQPPCVLTVAASDPSGAAGLQADLKTFEARQVYGLSAVTALSVQNSLSVSAFKVIEPEFVAAQIAALTADLPISAVKTGMLLRAETIVAVAEALAALPAIPMVIDPVLVAGDGRLLVTEEAIAAYKTHLFPRATVITPNLDEAAILTGLTVTTPDEMCVAAAQLHVLSAAYVLVKGGHLATGGGDAKMLDVLYDGREWHRLESEFLPANNPRGTGCTFASCIAAELAKGATVIDAVRTAKIYVAEVLRAAMGWHIGAGRGTVFHSVGRPPLGG
jgi:hydroxymethylpyrimidine/phosphomethylpyrimidine kinase